MESHYLHNNVLLQLYNQLKNLKYLQQLFFFNFEILFFPSIINRWTVQTTGHKNYAKQPWPAFRTHVLKSGSDIW